MRAALSFDVMRRFVLLILLCLFSAAIPSCASKKEPPATPYTSRTVTAPKPSILQNCLDKITGLLPKKVKPPTATTPQWAGVIRMVNSAENFVLVESTA